LQINKTFISITALWAFVEAGLGGFLHALHLPFTGIVIGGFAVVMISLLAQYSTKPFQNILQATLVVLAIKVMVNPATSPMAYIAVGFQGLLGASIFSIGKPNFISYLLFATISMLESAAQKLLMMTLLFGKTFWQGLDALGKQVANAFGNSVAHSYSNYLIIIYLSIFFIWGFILAIWMNALPAQIENRKNNYVHLQAKQEINQTIKQKNKSWQKIILALIIVLAITSVFFTSQNGFITGLIYLLRTIAILAIWQYALLPIWKHQIAKWSQRQKAGNNLYTSVQETMPQIANMVKPIYIDVSAKYKGITKWKEFLIGLIVVTLYPNEAK
jgi:hypothetical protein